MISPSRKRLNILDETAAQAAFFIPFLPAGALNTDAVNLPQTVKRGSNGGYLYTQSKEMRQVFVRRYFHSESIIDIAERFEMTESKVKSILHRMRLGLKTYLGEHEIHI